MAGAIAYISRDTDGLHWKKVLEEAFGPIDYRTLDSLGNTDDIEVALAWKPDRGLLASFKNLKLIVSLGMGVDHLLAVFGADRPRKTHQVFAGDTNPSGIGPGRQSPSKIDDACLVVGTKLAEIGKKLALEHRIGVHDGPPLLDGD